MAELGYKPAIAALSGTTAIIYIICAAAFAIAPTATLRLFNYFSHGVDLTTIAKTSMGLGSTILGLVLTTISAALVAALFVAIYNKYR